MSEQHLKWGLVGTSGYAARSCLPAFGQVADADLVAVVSGSQARADEVAAAHGVAKAYPQVSDLCEDPDVEAVWIATPSDLHFEQAEQLLKAGKHVLVEKLLALGAEEAWRLVELAESHSLGLAVGYQARYVPAHLRMGQIIASGELGLVTSVRSLYALRRTTPPTSWRADKDRARWGVLADIGTHHIDLMRMLVGEVSAATGLVGHQRNYATEDVAVAGFAFECGALGTMTVTGNYFTQTTVLEVTGTEGQLRATDTSPDGQGRAVLIRSDGTETDVTGETPRSFDAQLETVTRAFLGEKVDYATGRDGARNLEILETIAP